MICVMKRKGVSWLQQTALRYGRGRGRRGILWWVRRAWWRLAKWKVVAVGLQMAVDRSREVGRGEGSVTSIEVVGA